MTDVSQDLLWHGRALCRALDRAGRAERRVLELEAAAAGVLDAARSHARHLPPDVYHALLRLHAAAVLAAAPRMPQDAPEPPRTAEGSPDLLDVP